MKIRSVRGVFWLLTFALTLLLPGTWSRAEEPAKPDGLPGWLTGQWRGDTVQDGGKNVYECTFGPTEGGAIFGTVKHILPTGKVSGALGGLVTIGGSPVLLLDYLWKGARGDIVRLGLKQLDNKSKKAEFEGPGNWWPISVSYSIEEGKLRWKAVGKGAGGKESVLDVLMSPIN